MSRAALMIPLALALLAGCGGSSSETPWPAEPVGSAFEPVGESAAPPAAGSGEPVVETPPPR